MKSIWFLENHNEHFYSSIYFIYFNSIGDQSTNCESNWQILTNESFAAALM